MHLTHRESAATSGGSGLCFPLASGSSSVSDSLLKVESLFLMYFSRCIILLEISMKVEVKVPMKDQVAVEAYSSLLMPLQG